MSRDLLTIHLGNNLDQLERKVFLGVVPAWKAGTQVDMDRLPNASVRAWMSAIPCRHDGRFLPKASLANRSSLFRPVAGCSGDFPATTHVLILAELSNRTLLII